MDILEILETVAGLQHRRFDRDSGGLKTGKGRSACVWIYIFYFVTEKPKAICNQQFLSRTANKLVNPVIYIVRTGNKDIAGFVVL